MFLDTIGMVMSVTVLNFQYTAVVKMYIVLNLGPRDYTIQGLFFIME